MEYRKLGNSGIKVSPICLGTMMFGARTDAAEAGRIVDSARAAGINFIDTADAYAKGESERVTGKLIAKDREQWVLATKVGNAMGKGPNDAGLSRGWMMRAIDASLRRLGTDYVDLYQLHGFDEETPIDETLRALEDIVRSGRARYVGCSNFLAYQVARAIGRSELLGVVRLDSVQPRYNLLFREMEREMFPLCRQR